MSRAWIVIALAPLLVANGALPPDQWSLTVEAVQTPAAVDSAQPQLTVSKRGALLSWIERNGSTLPDGSVDVHSPRRRDL